MTFKEKLVLIFPLIYHGKVDGIVDREDVVLTESGKNWLAPVTLCNEGREEPYPYDCIAHGEIIDGEPSINGLWLDVVDSINSGVSFEVHHGLFVNRCI